MKDVVEGRVWCVGDDLDTDQLIAGKYLTIIDPAELRKHVLENVDPTFSAKAQPGDILIAGENMGCGSSRERSKWPSQSFSLTPPRSSRKGVRRWPGTRMSMTQEKLMALKSSCQMKNNR